MTTQTYLAGRKQYKRPQAMLWSDAPPITAINPLTAKNLIPNSGFSTTSNWSYSTVAGGTGTLESVKESIPVSEILGTDPLISVQSGLAIKATSVSGTGRIGILHAANIINVTAGQTYVFSNYVKDGTSGELFASYIEWRDATSVLSTTTGTSTAVSSSTWTRVSATAIAPVGATNVRIYTYSTTAPGSAGLYAYFSSPQFEQGSTPTTYTPQEYIYLPQGYEYEEISQGDDFIILSDHNRKDISFKPERIEKRERTINGRMRSYHVADKLTISTSWDMLPSRSFSNSPNFNSSGVASPQSRIDNVTGQTISGTEYTVDGGAGGNELLEWYQNHTGSFYVFLAYDNLNGFSINNYSKLSQYGQVIEMFLTSFDYTVVKRGGSNHDLWNVSITLEEV